MMRIINLALALLTLVAATALYHIKTETRRLEGLVSAREKHLDRLEGDIAHLTAERAFLTRPDRLEPLARAQGLVPLSGEHLSPLRLQRP